MGGKGKGKPAAKGGKGQWVWWPEEEVEDQWQEQHWEEQQWWEEPEQQQALWHQAFDTKLNRKHCTSNSKS